MLVHHHLIYQAKVWKRFGTDVEHVFEQFLYDLVAHIDMEVLISPRFAFTKDVNDAWTWIIGIVTSHISFHYRTKEQYVQLDIYSCKEFDTQKTIDFLNTFREGYHVQWLWINRRNDESFVVKWLEEVSSTFVKPL